MLPRIELTMVRAWPSAEAEKWVKSFIPTACSHASVLAVVAFGSAVRCTGCSADIDLLVVYQGDKPPAKGRPIDVDIRWYDSSRLEEEVAQGQELLGWIVKYGELICERNDFWKKFRKRWIDCVPFPSAVKAEERANRARLLFSELSLMGDAGAAREQYLVALTQEARAKLIRQHIYPASRPELPGQLRGIGESSLATDLEEALYQRAAL